jgi:hypothetical protein
MAIRVQTSSISGQSQLQPESFGIRKDTRNIGLEAAASALGQVAQVGSNIYQSNIQKEKRLEAAAKEAAQLRKQAEKEIAARQKAADQLRIDTRITEATNRQLILEAEVMRSIKNGTFEDPVVGEDGVEGPSLREQWQSIRTAEFRTDDLHDPTLAVKQRNDLDTDWIRASVRISNATDNRILLDRVSNDEIYAATTVDKTINRYATTEIPQQDFYTALGSIESFAESRYSRQLNENNVRTVNTQAQALAIKLFKHRIDTAFDADEINAIVEEFDTYNAAHNYISENNKEIASYAKEQIEAGFEETFDIHQERELRTLNSVLEFGKNIMSLSPTDPVPQVGFELALLDRVDLFNSTKQKPDGGKILNASQEQNMVEMQAFLARFIPNPDANEFEYAYSPIQMEAINEVKKLSDPNYKVSNILPEGLALYGETATKYTNYRNRLATYIHNGLENKDVRVLKALVPHLANNPRLQNEEMKRLFVDEFGYDERDFFIPSNIEVNFADRTSVALHINDVQELNIANPDVLLKRGFDLINQEDPSKEDKMLGQLYMAVGMAPDMNKQTVSNFVNNYIRVFENAANYGSLPDGYKTRADNLDTLPHLAELATYYDAQGRKDLHSYYRELRRGLIASSWFDLADTELKEEYQKKLEKKDKDEKAHNFKFDKIDKHIRKSVANTANLQLFSMMGATRKAPDFDTHVYIPPNIYNMAVETELDAAHPFLRDYLFGTRPYQAAQNHYANTFLSTAYKDTADAIANRLMEVNWTVMAENEQFNLRDAMTPTIQKIAEGVASNAAYKTSLKKEVNNFFEKLDKYFDDPDKLYDWVSSATIPLATTGEPKPAFRFDKISTHGGKAGTAPHIFNPATGYYEPIYYSVGKRKIQLIITEDEQRAVIREEGLTISAPADTEPDALTVSDSGIDSMRQQRLDEGQDY